MKTLADFTNRFLLLLDEPGSSATGVPNIPANATVAQTFITDVLNEGIAVFIEESGFAPDIADKYAQIAVVAGQDYVLPADLVALSRIEYLQGNNTGPLGNSPVYLPQLSFPAFDEQTGGVYNVPGVPQFYREPFQGAIRFYPYPVAANVTNLDQLFLYYTSNGAALVNMTDAITLPPAYAPAPLYYALAQYFQRKRDLSAAQFWEQRFMEKCNRAKRYPYNINQAAELTIGDADEDPTQLLWRY